MTLRSALLPRTTCPHCWHHFAPEEVLWISAHGDLLGDPLLGPEKQLRFLPSRFDLQCHALDARGVRCTELACPRCHLPLPRGIVELEPFFVSILGAPSAGKSYFLAAMTWGLRQDLARDFCVTFQDASPTANLSLGEYENSLFLNSRRDDLIPLRNLIRKTEEQGELYNSVMHGNQEVSYPRPFLFTLTPAEDHPNAKERVKLSRTMCLYDNSGEHFRPGMDTAKKPVTRHMAHSRLLMFLFDPTQDPRFRAKCAEDADAPAAPAFIARQETVLSEAISRIRSLTNAHGTQKHPHPLLVIVTKYDVWARLLGGSYLAKPPWKPSSRGIHMLDTEQIMTASSQVRALLRETSPEIVNAAEGFAEKVVYFPVSVLGRRPMIDPATKDWAIQPRNLKPLWCTAPLVFGLNQCLPGLIAKAKVTGTTRGG